jgi:hypothetical protein
LQLTDLFPGSTAKVLTVLLDAPSRTWTPKMVADAADIDERTVRRVITRLERLAVASVERQFSVGAIIALNGDNTLVRALQAFHAQLQAVDMP